MRVTGNPFMDDLVKHFQEVHDQNVVEFGPAEEIREEDVKIWRFSGMVDIETSLVLSSLDTTDLCEVLYQGVLCGSAVLRKEGPWLMADCVVDAAIPARLDFENGEKLYLHPVRGTNQLQLTSQRPFEHIEPITSTP